MLGYTTFGSNNYDKALQFYDTLLGTTGGKRMMELDNMVLYGFAQGGMFGVCRPHDGGKASPGNGTMIALNVGAREKVDAMHATALKLGGKDEGAPGPRGDTFYGAYFRDLDGNKLCAFAMGSK